MSEAEEDQRFARELAISPEEVRSAREAFSRNKIMRHIFKDRRDRFIEALRNTLESAPLEQILNLQAEVKATKAVAAAFLKDGSK